MSVTLRSTNKLHVGSSSEETEVLFLLFFSSFITISYTHAGQQNKNPNIAVFHLHVTISLYAIWVGLMVSPHQKCCEGDNSKQNRTFDNTLLFLLKQYMHTMKL